MLAEVLAPEKQENGKRTSSGTVWREQARSMGGAKGTVGSWRDQEGLPNSHRISKWGLFLSRFWQWNFCLFRLEAGEHCLGVHPRLDDLDRHCPFDQLDLLGHEDAAHAAPRGRRPSRWQATSSGAIVTSGTRKRSPPRTRPWRDMHCLLHPPRRAPSRLVRLVVRCTGSLACDNPSPAVRRLRGLSCPTPRLQN